VFPEVSETFIKPDFYYVKTAHTIVYGAILCYFGQQEVSEKFFENMGAPQKNVVPLLSPESPGTTKSCMPWKRK